MKKKEVAEGGLVYSTNPSASLGSAAEEQSHATHSTDLRVWLEKRNGKPCTIVRGFTGPDSEWRDLGRTLRQKCGVGGGDKEGEIILQGDVRKKVMEMLSKVGYRTKAAGG